MAEEKPKDAAEGTQPSEKCSVLTPLAGVRLAWALTGGFQKPEVAVAEKYETPKEGSLIQVAASSKPDEKDIITINTTKAEQLIESIGKTFPLGSAEEKYSHESAAAIRATVRNLATIYRGRDLNFKENDALRDVYMTSIKDGISIGTSLKDFAKTLPSLVISGGSALIFLMISITFFNVQVASGTVFVFSIIAAFSGFAAYWVILVISRWLQKKAYIRSDHERTLYYVNYLEHSKKELKALYTTLNENHEKFCTNKQKDILNKVWKLVCSLEISGGLKKGDFEQIRGILEDFKGEPSKKKLLKKLLEFRQEMDKNPPPENPSPGKDTEVITITETTKGTEDGKETNKERVTNISKVAKTTGGTDDKKGTGKDNGTNPPNVTEHTKASGPTKEDLDAVIDLVLEIDAYFCTPSPKDQKTDSKIEEMFESLHPIECLGINQCIYHPLYSARWWPRCETAQTGPDPCIKTVECSRKKKMERKNVLIVISIAVAVIIIAVVAGIIPAGIIPTAPGSVTLMKNQDVSSIYSNQTINVTVVLNNAGSTAISDIFIEDTVPPAFQYVEGDLTGFLPTLAPHSQKILRYTIQPRYPGTFTVFPANAYYTDRSGRILRMVSGVPEYTVLPAVADSGTVKVYKSIFPAVMGENQNTTVKVTVENTGTDMVKNLTIDDGTVPEGFTRGEGNTMLKVPILKAAESRSLHYSLHSVTSGKYLLDPAAVQFENGTANATQINSNAPVAEVIAGFSMPEPQAGNSSAPPEYNKTELEDALKKAAHASVK
jgi:uncharacterized repeat protein (TIGR01451 family)